MLTYVHCKLKQKHCTQELKTEQNTPVIAPLNRKIVVNCSSLRKPLMLYMQKNILKRLSMSTCFFWGPSLMLKFALL